jgi:hypothetical protein
VKRTARLGLAGLLLIAGSFAGTVPAARAAGPRLLLDRAELEPSWFGGRARLRLHVTAIQLEGALIPVGGAEPFVLQIGGSRRREPYLVGRYTGSGGATAVVVVVQTGWEMRDDLDAMRDAVTQLLDGLPADSQVALVSYGESVDGGNRLGAARAGNRLDALQADPAPADQQLVSAVERAVSTLTRARGGGRDGLPVRRLVVVLSDGKDADPDPARYRSAGERAERHGVRIHTIGFSAVDNRGPLLGLGELSKRSGGTFRWVRSREGFRTQMDTLLAEVNQQYVLTFFLPADQVVGKRIAVRAGELESNEIRIKEVSCGGAACDDESFCVRHACVERGDGGGGALRWILYIAGGVVGILMLLGAAAALTSRGRARAAGMPQALAAPVAGPGAPAGAPVPVATGSLLVVAGPYQGQRMPLRHGFLVGSARGCDFLVPGDPQVSPHHAMFVVDERGAMALVDRGSTTGTFVNGVRITEARLQHGNLIRIGSCSLRFLSQ